MVRTWKVILTSLAAGCLTFAAAAVPVAFASGIAPQTVTCPTTDICGGLTTVGIDESPTTGSHEYVGPVEATWVIDNSGDTITVDFTFEQNINDLSSSSLTLQQYSVYGGSSSNGNGAFWGPYWATNATGTQSWLNKNSACSPITDDWSGNSNLTVTGVSSYYPAQAYQYVYGDKDTCSTDDINNTWGKWAAAAVYQFIPQ